MRTASDYDCEDQHEVICFRSGLVPAEQATGSYITRRPITFFLPRVAEGESRQEKGGGFQGPAW